MTLQTPDSTHYSNHTTLIERPHLSHLSVCGTCHTVFGTGPEPWQRQLCDCASEWERITVASEAFEATDIPWNRIAELCRSCGAEVIDATDPFALWFCSTCARGARASNIGHGHVVIPLGRHTEVSRLPDDLSEDASDDDRHSAFVLHDFVARSFAINRRGRSVVEAHLTRAGIPSGQHVPLNEYLTFVRSDWVDQERHFVQLLSNLELKPLWRCYGHSALDLDWTTEVGPIETYVAAVESPWRYLDGREGTTTLHLRIISTSEGSWLWEINVGPAAAADGDHIIFTGAGPTVGDAAFECGWAAVHVIEREKERRSGVVWVLPPLFGPLAQIATDAATDTATGEPEPAIEAARQAPRPGGGSPCW